MPKLNNPFVMYGYKGEEYFCDRRKETEKMMRALKGERNITLVAPRRMGKTGLIHHLFEQIKREEPETRCFYIDIFHTKNLEQFVRLLANTVVGGLDSFSQSALRKLQEFFSRWRPSITFDEITGAPTVSLDFEPSASNETLKQIFDYIGQSDHRCIIAIDEFQQILNYPQTGVEALIRSYIQFLPNAMFIFSGSQQHLMQQMFMSANRPFFQSSMVMTLGSIDEEEYLAFANQHLRAQQRSIDKATFAHIFQKTDGITWYVQAILHGIFDHQDMTVDDRLVDIVINELIDEQSAAYQNYCAWLTENQLALIKAVAKERIVASPLRQGFIKKHNLPATSSVKTALKSLEDKQLIVCQPNGYVISDIFFGLWLKKHD